MPGSEGHTDPFFSWDLILTQCTNQEASRADTTGRGPPTPHQQGTPNPNPNPTTPSVGKPSTASPVSQTDAPNCILYVVQLGNSCQSVSSPHRRGGGSRILRAINPITYAPDLIFAPLAGFVSGSVQLTRPGHVLSLALAHSTARPNRQLSDVESVVYATATWLAGWVAGCHSRYCIKMTKPILKLF